MSPKLNTANAVIVPLNASGRLVVTPNCGPGCTADTTEVRGVVLGYFSTALAQRVAALETLLASVTRTTHNGYATRRFNRLNLQLTNGTGNTYTGNGNLIVGYDTNLIGCNEASGENSSVSGGAENGASGRYSSVSGGFGTVASGPFSSISGGAGNATSGFYSSVSGGSNRSVTGETDWRAGELFQDQ